MLLTGQCDFAQNEMFQRVIEEFAGELQSATVEPVGCFGEDGRGVVPEFRLSMVDAESGHVAYYCLTALHCESEDALRGELKIAVKWLRRELESFS